MCGRVERPAVGDHISASETIEMQELSSEELKFVDDVARRHGVGSDAVAALLRALALANGAQAQFTP